MEERGLSSTTKTVSNGEAFLLNERELLDEYSLGIISPNKSRIKVRRTVSTTNSTHSAVPKSTILPKNRSSKSIIATLTILLAINNVANNRSESFNRKRAFASRMLLPLLICFVSVGDNEKKAISEADTNPDTTIKSRAIIKAIIDPADGELNFILL